jgi:hypothetical protein
MIFDNDNDNYIYKAVMILYSEDSDSKDNFAPVVEEEVSFTAEDSKISKATRDPHDDDRKRGNKVQVRYL